jgi:glucose/arabinose dehydrogenase/cytochrome c5
MKTFSLFGTALASATLAATTLAFGPGGSAHAQGLAKACGGDSGGLSLPPGFCATIFAEHIGHARQMAVGSDGTLYVNTWSGRYYNNDKPQDGGFVVALKDTTGAGTADRVARFGGTAAEGDNGGTGINLYNGKLYVETNDKIVRYDLPAGGGVPTGKPDIVVSDLPVTGDHPMHPFLIDATGALFVDLGTATNACQAQNRVLGALGQKPCKELDTRGGIWRYDANRTGQVFSPAERYATGLRNGEGFASDAQGRVYVTQHGRDQLAENWPQLYTEAQGRELPAEELVQLTKGADYGWPMCYFDSAQDKLVLAPEYGGDGGKKIGVCADKTRPVAAFPAHWAPNDLAIYKGTLFPKIYEGAAFIAFHGSWNRAPAPQGGYNVVVQPMAGGQPSGKYEIFADGFAGPDKNPGQAIHRPSGLAVGTKGELYISDDIAGTIWRVTYQGEKSAAIMPAPAVSVAGATTDAGPPEGTHADAVLVAPEGTTSEQVALGARIFHGEAKSGNCAACHGSNARGLPIGPGLIKADWLWSDGSLKGIEATITSGVPQPKSHPGMMPPMGGAPLTPDDVKAVAAYIYALNHQS